MTTLLRTPLAATAAVIAGLALMAIPLRQLTRATDPSPAPADAPTSDTTRVPAWISLKLLSPADAVTLSTPGGDPLWSLGATPAGDHEIQAGLPVTDGQLELILEVKRPDHAPETAAFLTITPDGLEQRQAHIIGTGTLRDLVELRW